MSPMLSPHELGFWSANPHLWVPPLLLGAFFAGLLIRRLYLSRRPPSLPGPEAPSGQMPPTAAPLAGTAPAAPRQPLAAEAAPPRGAPLAAPPPAPPPAAPEKPATLGSGLSKTRAGWRSKLAGLFAGGALTAEIYGQ